VFDGRSSKGRSSRRRRSTDAATISLAAPLAEKVRVQFDARGEEDSTALVFTSRDGGVINSTI